MLDVIEVHLYVGAKAAVTGDASDPDIAGVRTALAKAGTARQDPAADKTKQAMQVTALSAKVAIALWKLRGLGKTELRKFHDSTLPPVVGTLLKNRPTDPVVLDKNTDHAVLAVGLGAIKMHPDAPIPISTKVVLYEAYMTDTSKLKIPGLQAWAQATKAHLLASHGLCSMAQVETDRLAEQGPITAHSMTGMLKGLGRLAAHAPSASIVVGFVAGAIVTRLLAHGHTAMCFRDRGDIKGETRELKRLLDVTDALGIPNNETAIVRAYVAYRNGDIDRTVIHLKQARESALLDDSGRARLDEVIEHFSKGDRGVLAKYMDKAFFAKLLIRISVEQLKKAGVFDKLAQVEPFQSILEFGATLSAGMQEIDATDRLDEAAEHAKGWFDDWLE